MKHSKLSILTAMFLIVSASTALAKGGGGGGGPGGGIGGGPGVGIGGPHGGSVGAGVPSPGSLPGLPSHVPGSGLPSHRPAPDHRKDLPRIPHAPMPQTSVNKSRGLDRAASRMSPQGLKNTNNPRSPNRAHGRARAAERHAMADLPGRR